MKLFKTTSLIILLTLSSCLVHGATGKIGDKAPEFTGLEWIKGDAVKLQKDSVYVVEFWATWCGPCKTSIPHLTELQHKYKDKKVTIIGVSNGKIDKVKPFVEKQGDQMDYTIAIDTAGDINNAYMKAFDYSGIPHAFIVDRKGLIAWHGHPMRMDDILEQVVAGTFDGVAYEKQKAEEKAKAEQERKDNLAALEKKLAENENDFDSLIAYGQLLQQRREDRKKANEVFAKALKLDPQKCADIDDPSTKRMIQMAEFEANIAEINTAIENDPDNTKLLIKRAETYLGDNFVKELSYSPSKLAKALADYKKVLELDPEDKNNAAEHVQFFETWQLRDDTRNQALSDFCEKYPNSIRKPFAMYTLYYYANKEGDTETALKYLKDIEKAKLDSGFGQKILKIIEQLQNNLNNRKTKKVGTIGSQAAALSGLEWVKGDPVKIEAGSVYVVEFWATWCGPCKTSIPHLTELQHKYKDKKVTIIGVSNGKIDKVKPFVEKQGDKMDYTVAVDNGDINNAYMKAFDYSGIPHAFIVDRKGLIAWHGHPMRMDDILEQVVAGTFDAEAYARKQAQAKEKAQKLSRNFKNYFKNPADKDAKKIGNEIVKDGSSQTLNSFAWKILTDVKEEDRDLKLALKAAEKGVELTHGKEPAILDTCAKALFDSGKITEAYHMQKKAVNLSASNAQMNKELKQTLDNYTKTIKEKTIITHSAPAWNITQWSNLPAGKKSLSPADYKGKVLYLTFFQSWCPGCKTQGLPKMKAVRDHYAGSDKVAFATIQTVFEGFDTNTPKAGLALLKTNGLDDIPYGYTKTNTIAGIMKSYKAGGTPWTVIIDQNGIVEFSDFFAQKEQSIELIDQLIENN